MLRLLFCFLVFQIAGCAWLTNITNLGDNNESLKPRQLEPLKKEVELDRLWKTKIGKSKSGRMSMLVPQISSSSIYAASPDGTVKALKTSNGRELWTVNVSKFYQTCENVGF